MPFLLPAYDPIVAELSRCCQAAWGVRKVLEGWPETDQKVLPYAVIVLEEVGIDNQHSAAEARHIYEFEICLVKEWPKSDRLDRAKIEALDQLLALIMDYNGVLNGDVAYWPQIKGHRLNAINTKSEEIIGPSVTIELSFDQAKLNNGPVAATT